MNLHSRRAFLGNVGGGMLAASLGQAGQVAEAQPVIRSLLGLVPGLTVGRFMKETRFRYPAYSDLLMDGLRKAGLPE